MGERTEEMVRTWTEAPASINLKFQFKGYDSMLTLRGESGAEVLPKLEAAITWLSDHGACGLISFGGNGTEGGNEPEAKVCPIHHVQMRRREKHGDVWWSHKAINPETGEEYWCRGKAE
jgi:hypothetical protein